MREIRGLLLLAVLLAAPGAFAQSADLAVTKTDSPDPVVAGANLTYTVTVTNNGPADAQNVVLTDMLPPDGVIFRSATQTSGPPATITPPPANSDVVTATIPTLPSGASATFSILVEVWSSGGSPFGANGIRNTASVTSGTPDPVTANNSVTQDTAITFVTDLQVTKSARPSQATPGGLLTYSLSVTNAGPSTDFNTAIVDVIPANTTFVSAVQTAGPVWGFTAPPPGGTGTFGASALTSVNIHGIFGPGGTVTFDLTVRVNDDVAPGTVIANTVTTSADPSEDPNLANNTATVNTAVVAATAIPTLSWSMLLLLGVALAAAALFAIR